MTDLSNNLTADDVAKTGEFQTDPGSQSRLRCRSRRRAAPTGKPISTIIDQAIAFFVDSSCNPSIMFNVNRPKRTATKADPPEPYGIKSGATLNAITGIGLAYPLIRSLLPNFDVLNHTHIGQYLITWATGVWFWIRYHFTESATTRVKGFPSLACTILLMMVGLACFPLSEFQFWFLPHAIVLILAVEKDIEVMVFQRRLA